MAKHESIEAEIARLKKSPNVWDNMKAANLEKWGRAES